MGKVNVVRPDGTVVAVDEELLNAAAGEPGGTRPEAVAEGQSREQKAYRAARGGEAMQSLAAGIFGGMDAASFGLVGKGLNALTAGEGDNGESGYQQLRREHPVAGEIGALGGLVADPFGAVGVASRIGGAAKVATESAAVGRAVEGGLIGAGGYVANTNVTGDPLTIEGLVEGAGVGALINVGVGALADGVRGAGERAKAAATTKSETDLAFEGRKLFRDETPAWAEFRDSYESGQHVYREANRAISANNTAYEEFVANNSRLTSAIKSAETALNDVSARYSPVLRGAELPAEEAASRFDLSDVPAAERGGARSDLGTPIGPGDLLTANGTVMTRGGQMPPISPELRAKLQDYRAAISRAYKLKGGGWEVDAGKWVRNPSAPANPTGALEQLRAVSEGIQRDFPKASGRLKELPTRPTAPIPYEDIDLPNSLRDFARMRPETVTRLANTLDKTTSESFARVLDELGLSRGATPAESVAALHNKLGDYLRAIDSFESLSASKRAGGGLVDMLRSGTRNAAANVAGFVGYGVVGGGIPGVAAGALARTATRRGLQTVEETTLGGAMIQAKEGFRSKIADVVARYGNSAGGALEKSAPVLAYLNRAFPSGEPDHEPDVRRAAASRAREIAELAATAPDVLYAAVQGILGQPGDVAGKLHAAVLGAIDHLNATAPTDPGLAMKMAQSEWTPSYQEAWRLAHRIEAVLDPVGSLKRLLGGGGDPAAGQTLRAVFPTMMSQFTSGLGGVRDGNWQKAAGLSNALGLGLGFQNPLIATALQGMYLPKPSGPSTPSSGPSGPVGRPPAVSPRDNTGLTQTQRLQH